MKITHLICQVLRVGRVAAKTASCQDAVLVRIRTDNGLEGIGEADSSPEVVKAIVDAPFSHNIACGLRELLIGENPLETERLWQKMYRGTVYFGRTSVTITAMAAIDMALWDLKGKHFGEPIHRLLGGKQRDSIPAYASILFGRDGAETADIGRRWREAGYRAVKFGWEPMGKLRGGRSRTRRGHRRGIGDDSTLLIDAGLVWDVRGLRCGGPSNSGISDRLARRTAAAGRRRRLRLAARPLPRADRSRQRGMRPRSLSAAD